MSLRNLVNVLPEEHVLKIIETKPELVNWRELSANAELPEEFIEKHSRDVDWYNILSYQKHLPNKFRAKHSRRI